jgi:hypothetical protein
MFAAALLVLVTTAPADAPAPASPSAQAGPALMTAPAAKKRVLVLEPTSDSLPPETRKAIASLIVAELQNKPGIEVMSANELQKMAAFTAEKQSLGCDTASCLSELAGAVGAELIIFGDAATLGTLTLVNLSLFDAAHAAPVQRAQERVERPEDMPAKIAEATRTLVAGLAPEPAPVAETPRNARSAVLPLVCLIGGGAVLAGGFLYDALAATSRNGKLDGGDFVGPAAYVVGPAAMIAGIVVWVVE